MKTQNRQKRTKNQEKLKRANIFFSLPDLVQIPALNPVKIESGQQGKQFGKLSFKKN